MHVQVYTYIAVKYIKRTFVGALLMKLSMCGFLQFFCFHAALIDIIRLQSSHELHNICYHLWNIQMYITYVIYTAIYTMPAKVLIL